MNRKKSILKTQSLVRRKRRMLWLKAALLVIISGALVVGIVLLFHIQKFLINTISVQGALVVPEAEVKSLVGQKLAGNFIYAFPKRNVALYPKSGIKEELFAKYPRIENLDLSLHSWNTLQVDITERKPYAIWCKEIPLIQEGNDPTILGDCYFMDATGYIFDLAPHYSGEGYVRYYGNLEGEPIGQRFNPPVSFMAAESFMDSLKSKNIIVTDIVVNEFDYEMFTKAHQKLYIDPHQDIDKTLENLFIILEQAGSTTGAWQYIDLRFGNKVYLKPS